jgi:hypothetical protein
VHRAVHGLLTTRRVGVNSACTDFGRPEKAQEGPMTVWIYVDTSKQVGDKDHLNANEDAAETWLQENDPEGVAFEYEVLE